jgi:hypothetical protein
MNWRARLFFDARRKIETRVRRFQRLYDDTGRQPGTLSEAERLKITGDLEAGWVEKAVVNPQFFNSVVGILLIAFAIVLLSKP